MFVNTIAIPQSRDKISKLLYPLHFNTRHTKDWTTAICYQKICLFSNLLSSATLLYENRYSIDSRVPHYLFNFINSLFKYILRRDVDFR
jgi:hypothetical protein